LKPLLHTWSLAVEEQFYLVFPPFLLLVWRLGRNRVLWLILGLAVFSLWIAHVVHSVNPTAAFYLLPTRAWELLMGSALALWARGRSGDVASGRFWFSELGGLLGLLLLGYSIFFFDKETPFPGVYTLVPTIGAVLIIACSHSGSWVGRLLSVRFLVFLGLLSYSAYLWHQPLMAFTRHLSRSEPASEVMAGVIGLTWLLAYASWKWIESPFRSRDFLGPRSIAMFTVLFGVSFTVLGLAGHLTKGFPSRLPEYARLSPDIDMPRADNGWCFYSIDSISSLKEGRDGLNCWLGDKLSSKKAILFGD
jgi:peptidoglycan/LPS O-acetylase OafA/YrhL